MLLKESGAIASTSSAPDVVPTASDERTWHRLGSDADEDKITRDRMESLCELVKKVK